jgi:hypothetical protein
MNFGYHFTYVISKMQKIIKLKQISIHLKFTSALTEYLDALLLETS